LDRAVYEYNFSVHSVTKKRPLEVFFGRNVTTDPEKYERSRQDNIDLLKDKQKTDLETHNKSRNQIQIYTPGQEIFVKRNTRLGSKLSPRFKKEIVKEDKNTTILTEAGRIVHKSNIKINRLPQNQCPKNNLGNKYLSLSVRKKKKNYNNNYNNTYNTFCINTYL